MNTERAVEEMLNPALSPAEREQLLRWAATGLGSADAGEQVEALELLAEGELGIARAALWRPRPKPASPTPTPAAPAARPAAAARLAPEAPAAEKPPRWIDERTLPLPADPDNPTPAEAARLSAALAGGAVRLVSIHR